MVKVTQHAVGAPGSSSRADGDLRLSAIYVFPVKSAKGIKVNEARATATGFEFDRRWMVVDQSGRFVTQRTQPRLVHVDTALTADHLVLSAPGHGEVRVPLKLEPEASQTVTVWHDTLPAREESRQAAEFFSDLLGAAHKLVRFPEAGERAVPRVPKDGRAGGEYADSRPSEDRVTGRRVQFADAFPFLLISQGSLDLLNEKLAAKGVPPMGMERFRPNLVVSGCEPHAEDRWDVLFIGDMRFDVVKPCARCSIPSVDPEKATYGVEPLRTLATYRREAGKVLFGQNLVHHDEGVVTSDAPCVALPSASAGDVVPGETSAA